MDFHPVQPERATGQGHWCSLCLHECGAFQSMLMCVSVCVSFCMCVVYMCMHMPTGITRPSWLDPGGRIELRQPGLCQATACSSSSCCSLPSLCTQTQPWDFFLHLLLQQPFLWQEGGSCDLLPGWCSRCRVDGLSKWPASFPPAPNVSPWRFSIWQGSSSPEVIPGLCCPVLNYSIKWASLSEIMMFSHYVKLTVVFKDGFIAFSLMMGIISWHMQ